MSQHRGPWPRQIAGLVALFAVFAGSVQAQDRRGSPRAFLDITAIVAEPVGEFSRNVDQGWGLQFGGRFPMDPSGVLSMRLDGGFITYGRERIFGCSFTCRVGLDVTTTNSIAFLGVGPELAPPAGAVRPYVGVEGGLGYFFTSSSLGGSDSYHDFASTTNFDDAVFQWRGRGGVQIRVSGGERPVYLDLGGEYHANGVAEYLREGDIVDEPDGSVAVFPTRSEANLWVFRLGVSIALGRGDDHGRRRRGGGRR